VVTPEGSADVVVIGAGLVGLAVAAAVAERGGRVLLLADVRRGEASPAAAGVLAPTVSPASGAAHAFAIAARERYPNYLAALGERTGIEVPLNRLGILRIALGDDEAAVLEAGLPAGTTWLDRPTLVALEPGLAHARGAAFHPHDGAVNNLVLMRALKAALARDRRVTIVGDAAEEIALDDRAATVLTRDGARHSAARVVLASGAWAPHLGGLPRALPIEPVRGQMMSVASKLLRHVVYGGAGYAVPRPDGRTLVGSTSERVGFDAGHTEAGVAAVRGIAAAISPQLAPARMLNAWAGLRPVTPDLLPILGVEPTKPSLIYACGHSRNGVLLAPLTGDCVAALCAGDTSPVDITPFSPARFAA
jgi:glycine oxidase